MNTRIVLCQTSFWNVKSPPYTLAMLTGALRSKGFVVVPRDYDLEFHLWAPPEDRHLWTDAWVPFWMDADKVTELVREKFQDFIDWCARDALSHTPDVVGFSTKITTGTTARLVAERIKQLNPKVKVLFGGPEMWDGVEKYLTPYPYIDAICRQEADVSFPNFMIKYENAGGVFQPEPGWAYRGADGMITDCGEILQGPGVEDIPLADYSDFDFTRYQEPNTLTLLLSRGCINRCSFCTEAPAFLKYRYYEGRRIHDEILHQLKTSNVARPVRVAFNDSLLNGNLAALEHFADLVLETPIPGGMKFGGMMLVRKHMSDALMHKLARAGLDNILLGMESGSDVVIAAMRKKFDLNEARRIIRAADDAGIFLVLSIIFGHPGETELEFHKTVSFLMEMEPHVDVFLLNVLQIYAQSYLGANPQKYGIDFAGPEGWQSDDGGNTQEIRKRRQAVARALLGKKARDYGNFDPAFTLPTITTAQGGYALGRVIDFSNKADGGSFVGVGWSEGEDWGRWSDGDQASLSIPVPAQTGGDLILRFEGDAYVGGHKPTLKVRVEICGEMLGEWFFRESDIDRQSQGFWTRETRIPAALVEGRRQVDVVFHIDAPVAPSSHHASDDSRRLGIGLRRLRLSAEGPRLH
ncbi:radical SAM protein [Magnetospirillum sp. 64-120]|uniref:B12-binding domain-containing radical SAM protein n=1 Tax=Magnetospirillum sp. 64-120 TaxID=1895778 RepID=UPI0009264329|nr:radical SAM protein [Magnetospirillum sp. 64-120]OJX82948.1 MAG: hypothetical protein BGO92_11750 [Magnetospirillum sp. 64-120]